MNILNIDRNTLKVGYVLEQAIKFFDISFRWVAVVKKTI